MESFVDSPQRLGSSTASILQHLLLTSYNTRHHIPQNPKSSYLLLQENKI